MAGFEVTPHGRFCTDPRGFMAVFSLSQLLGLLLSGGLANSIGVRHLFTSSAVLLVVLSGIGFLWLRDDKPAEDKAVVAAGSMCLSSSFYSVFVAPSRSSCTSLGIPLGQNFETSTLSCFSKTSFACFGSEAFKYSRIFAIIILN